MNPELVKYLNRPQTIGQPMKSPAESVAKIFQHEDDCFFTSKESDKVIVQLDNELFLMTADFQIKRLIEQ